MVPWLLQGQQALFNVLKAYALHDMEASAARLRSGSLCGADFLVVFRAVAAGPSTC